MNETETGSHLRPAMGFKDPLLFFIGAGIGIRWVTVAAIILSVIPADDESNKPLAVAKVVGLALVLALIGVVIYLVGSKRQAQELNQKGNHEEIYGDS